MASYLPFYFSSIFFRAPSCTPTLKTTPNPDGKYRVWGGLNFGLSFAWTIAWVSSRELRNTGAGGRRKSIDFCRGDGLKTAGRTDGQGFLNDFSGGESFWNPVLHIQWKNMSKNMAPRLLGSSEMALQKCSVNFSARILGWIFWCEFLAVSFSRVNFKGALLIGKKTGPKKSAPELGAKHFISQNSTPNSVSWGAKSPLRKLAPDWVCLVLKHLGSRFVHICVHICALCVGGGGGHSFISAWLLIWTTLVFTSREIMPVHSVSENSRKDWRSSMACSIPDLVILVSCPSLSAQRLKKQSRLQIFNLARKLQSRLKISISTFRIPHRNKRVWWVARLKFSISLENFVRALPRKFVFLGFRREESGMSREFMRGCPGPLGVFKTFVQKKSPCAFFVP